MASSPISGGSTSRLRVRRTRCSSSGTRGRSRWRRRRNGFRRTSMLMREFGGGTSRGWRRGDWCAGGSRTSPLSQKKAGALAQRQREAVDQQPSQRATRASLRIRVVRPSFPARVAESPSSLRCPWSPEYLGLAPELSLALLLARRRYSPHNSGPWILGGVRTGHSSRKSSPRAGPSGQSRTERRQCSLRFSSRPFLLRNCCPPPSTAPVNSAPFSGRPRV